MLHITDQAAALIRDLLDTSNLDEGAGLRIAQRDDHTALAMNLCGEPRSEDVVLVEHEAPVFLGPVAARRTERQTLDAAQSDTSTAFFLRD